MNKVKTRTEYTTTIDPELKETGEEFKSSFCEYNINGDIIHFESFTEEGVMDGKITSKFDNEGHVLEEINCSSDDEFTDKTLYIRKDNGEIEQIELFYPGNTKTIKRYIRNESSHKLEIQIVDDDGDLEGRELIVFDENDNVLEKLTLDYDGKHEEKLCFEYDKSNKLIHRKEVDRKDKIIIQDRFFYDDNNNMIKRIRLNRKNKPLEIVMVKYNENNKAVEQNFNNQYILQFEYDKKGNTIKEVRKNEHGLIEHEAFSSYNDEGLIVEEKSLFDIKTYKYEFYN